MLFFFSSSALAADPWICPEVTTPAEALGFLNLADEADARVVGALHAVMDPLDDGSCPAVDVDTSDGPTTQRCCTTAAGDDWCHITGSDEFQTTWESWSVAPAKGEWSRIDLRVSVLADDDGYHGRFVTSIEASWEGAPDGWLPADSAFSSSDSYQSGDDSNFGEASYTMEGCAITSQDGTDADEVRTYAVSVNGVTVTVVDDPTDICHFEAGALAYTLDGLAADGWVERDTWVVVPDPCASEEDTSATGDTADTGDTAAPGDTGKATAGGCGCATGHPAVGALGLLGLLAVRRRRRG